MEPLVTQSRRALAAVREEEEETQRDTQGSTSRKRKTPSSGHDDDDGSGLTETQIKRRAIENVNAVHSALEAGIAAGSIQKKPSAAIVPTAKPPKGDKVGAPVGKPDKDVAFLTALASQKKGKKGEDDFDREFNMLKLQKPPPKGRATATRKTAAAAVSPSEEDDLLVAEDREAREKEREKQEGIDKQADEWKILEDFDDLGIAGNYMTIMEMEVDYHPERHRNAGVYGGGKTEWVGRPNYKKFIRVSTFCESASLRFTNDSCRNKMGQALLCPKNNLTNGVDPFLEQRRKEASSLLVSIRVMPEKRA